MKNSNRVFAGSVFGKTKKEELWNTAVLVGIRHRILRFAKQLIYVLAPNLRILPFTTKGWH
jgi:hypothetical protein